MNFDFLKKDSTLSAFMVAVGIALAGLFVSQGIETYANRDHYVTVKGLSERDVLADKVVWPITFNEVSNDLMELNATISAKQKAVVNFLRANGLSDSEISVGAPAVTDRLAQLWSAENVQQRYQATTTVTVTSTAVEKVLEIKARQAALMQDGVAISSDEMQFMLTSLNALKPDMVQDATKNARAVAEKFAQDADCRLGSIKFASQGQFSVSNNFPTPHIMHVRVVTTVDYFLR